MKEKILLIAIALAASLGYAQNSGSGTPSSSSSTSSAANSGASAQANGGPITITLPAGEIPHQLVQATPGPIPGMFPGNALGPGVCVQYDPNILRYLSRSAIKAMAKSGKLPHGVKPTLINPDAANASSYDGPIGIMRYDPTGSATNDGDIQLAGITVPGKPFEINEKLLGVAVKALEKVAPAMQRVAVFNCYIFAEVTTTTSKGIGAVGSGSNATGQIGASASIGWFHGMSSTEQQRHIVTTVYAMNGPYNLLTPPSPPEPKKDDGASAPPAAPNAQPPAPPPPVAKEVPAPPAPEPPPPPPAAAIAPLDGCLQDQLPKLNVPFKFDSATMTSEGLSVALQMENWLEKHPACRIEIKGGACKHGGKAYNLNLGFDRAEAVFEVMNKNEKIRSQLIKPESHGKQQATLIGSKADMAEDRVVYFAIEGSDSH